MANSCKIDEFEVPVPWGHIACKTWGDETDPPILVVHGRLDNAGAFDRLIPLLPRQFYYICVDLPGHGRSSHFPSPLPIHTLDFVMVYRLILEHFKKDRLIILGHSYGGQLALLFSRLYPEKVEKLVLLDCMILYPVEVDEFKSYVLKKIEGNINLQKKLATRHQPKYSYEEAKFRLSSNRYNDKSLDPEAAEALLKRCLKQTGDGKYVFTVDQRMKNYINPLHDIRFALESLERDPIRCPTLIILTNNQKFSKVKLDQIIAGLKKLDNVSFQLVNGGHDIHNNHPDLVAPYVSKFLLTQKGKL